MKKRALLYVRVSTDEQAENGYSLKLQEDLLVKSCQSNNIEIVKIFSEDYTAWKGFNRPAYNELSEFIKQNKKSVDLILFTQWSRFSREATYALNEINRLKEYGIEANAVEQPIDFKIPENLYLLVVYLTASQVENERLSLRTKAGIRQARKEGRWLGRAPFGYTNNKQTKLIEIDVEKAPIVKMAFELFKTGNYTMEEVRRHITKMGYNGGKQSFINMLNNSLYAGKIEIPETDDEPANIIDGLHEPIIDYFTFNQVQSILTGKRKPYKGITKHTEIALANLIVCPKCGRMLTGSASKGNGGIYHYYHCQRKYGCNYNVRASFLNDKFNEYLSTILIKPEIVKLYEAILQDVFDKNTNNIKAQQDIIERKIKALEKNIEFTWTKYCDGVLTDTEYRDKTDRFKGEKNDLVMQHTTLKCAPSEFSKYMSFGLTLLSNLDKYYKNAPTETKKMMIGSIFPEKLRFENNSYRTTKMCEVFTLICTTAKDINKKRVSCNTNPSTKAPPSGLEPETP